MKKLEYRVTFTTPAFLGNAEQDGQWRTPPFKALLRQWWRVAYADGHRFQADLATMRREEGLLFGNAWLSHRDGNRDVADFSKSLVRIRLDRWERGVETRAKWGQQELRPDTRISHPEVGQIGPLLYLGYGPLVVEKVQGQGPPRYATVLKKNAAIQAGESANLSFAVPDEVATRIERALWLVNRYGTIGGRSRNGWGSFSLEPVNGTAALAGAPALRDWRQALGLDWPHALGEDQRGPLIWRTAAFGDWRSLMRELAVLKIGLRTQFTYSLNAANGDRAIIRRGKQVGINHGRPQERHWLSFPVTNHPVSAWGGNARLPNSLRFKVRPAENEPKKVVGVVFHVPCLPPPDFRPDLRAIQAVWQRVHAFLDAPAQKLTRAQE